MRIRIVITRYLILLLLLTPVLTVSVSSQAPSLSFWNENWSYRQEIKLPISTDKPFAKYQPIDIHIEFDHDCWAKNEDEHSIRVCCWDGNNWHELESQIYDLDFVDVTHIEECNVVFLVPEIADGNEKYYVYYDDDEKPAPNYKDHVSVEDSYYFSKPLADISAEATYYGIKEDGYYIYGIGQKGQFLNRPLSQVVVKQKPRSEIFDILNSDQIASFSFSYYYGDREEDEISSEQSFVHKKIFVDGNLMVEFGIISESSKAELRTTAIYKYYYNPHRDKRICAHIKHEVLQESIAEGKENLDGRYGALVSFRSRNPAINKLNFGDILPFLHFFGENDDVEEYPMITNPESKEREWIISFTDDADLGKESWIAYGEGREGKSHAIIFSSNTGIVKSGTDERDGIQLKVAEREYFDFLGTEVDYASINFGRNSYESGYSHDLVIPSNLVVEFDAELFTSEDGGYQAAQKEAEMYQELAKHRHLSNDPSFEQEQKKHDLTVFTHFGGTRFSFPWLANKTGISFPAMWIEVYCDGNLISSGTANRHFFKRAYKTFHDLTGGKYLIKVYWKFSNSTKFFNGAKVVELHKDTKVHVFCTWQRVIQLTFSDQNGKGIEDITAVLLDNDDVVFAQNITDGTGEVVLTVPHNSRDRYRLKAYYRDFVVYDGELEKTPRKIRLSFEIELYDLTVEVKDGLGLPPGVDIHPTLSSTEFDDTLQILPVEREPGSFFFEDIPSGNYKLQISYANFLDEKFVNVPEDGDFVNMKFTAEFDLVIELFDSRGNLLEDHNFDFEIIRERKKAYTSVSDRIFSLPPGSYTIKVYLDDTLYGVKNVELTSDRNIKIVTTLKSIFPTLVVWLTLVFTGELVVLTLFKKISLSSLLKCVAIALIVIALVQPWWELTGSSIHPIAERNTKMFIIPQTMIESITYDGKTHLDLAAVPEVFIEFLGNLILVAYSACILIGLSFILTIFRRKRVSLLLLFVSAILLIIMAGAFSVGMSKICEASIGVLQGEGILNVAVDDETILMSSNWGLSSGFYLCIISAIAAITAGVLDFYNSSKCKNLRKNHRF